MTVRELRLEAARRLEASGIEHPMLDARVLLADVMGVSPTALLIADGDPVETSTRARFLDLVAIRGNGTPLAYLIGEREFMGIPFRTTPDVLVPRPDTEPLVEWGLAWLAVHPLATVADVGTGSGAIAVATAHHAPANWQGTLIAIDLSPAALTVAEENAKRNLTDERRTRIEFRQGNLATPLTAPVDLLLANLPYLTPTQITGNPDLRHEPLLALDGGEDGLDLVRLLIADLDRVLHPAGAIGLEIDPFQAAAVSSLLDEALPHHTVDIVADLAGDDRHVVAYQPEEAQHA